VTKQCTHWVGLELGRQLWLQAGAVLCCLWFVPAVPVAAFCRVGPVFQSLCSCMTAFW